MATLTKQQLLDQTNAKIRANGQRLITGDVLNDVLIDIIDSVQIGGGSGLGTWSAGNQYSVGNCVVYGSQIWQANTTPTAGTFNAFTEWNMISKPDTVVADIAERNSMTVRFIGMTVFVQSTAETFRLIGGTSNTNWNKISTLVEVVTPITITSDGQTFFDLSSIEIGDISHLEINGVRYENKIDFEWNGNVLSWIGVFDIETDDIIFLIHNK